MDTAVDNDETAIDVVASGLRLQHGAQIAIDRTPILRLDSQRQGTPQRSG